MTSALQHAQGVRKWECPAQAVYAMAFATTALSSLAFVVHLFVLQLFTHDPHLPACSPDQRVCAETYNLLLVMCANTPFPQLACAVCAERVD